MNWFKKIFGKESLNEKVSAIQQINSEFAHLNYPPKVLLAWIKAIEGNNNLALFLYENGYEELFHTTQALFLKEEARNWLMNNGYAHLLAFVNSCEGNANAQRWLQMHGFETLFHVSNAADGEMTSFGWLKTNEDAMLFLLARTIKKLKDQIEFNHNDMYSFGKDY